MTPITELQMETLWNFLKDGETPEGITIHETHLPKLNPEQAMTIVWFLQEVTGALPDNWERCEDCDCLYDTANGGGYVDDDYLAAMQQNGETMLPEGMNKHLCGWHLCQYIREYDPATADGGSGEG